MEADLEHLVLQFEHGNAKAVEFLCDAQRVSVRPHRVHVGGNVGAEQIQLTLKTGERRDKVGVLLAEEFGSAVVVFRDALRVDKEIDVRIGLDDRGNQRKVMLAVDVKQHHLRPGGRDVYEHIISLNAAGRGLAVE